MSQFKIKRKNHPNKHIHSIADFLTKSEFTDVQLVAAGGTLRAHRVILASSSTYFYVSFYDPVNNFKRFN
jgi:hypothetical protein